MTAVGELPDDDDVLDDDYDDYAEFVLLREPDIGPRPGAEIQPAREENGDIGPSEERPGRPRSAPADAWHSLLDDPVPQTAPIGFARNGSHVDERRIPPITEFTARRFGSVPRDDRRAPSAGRHHNGTAHHRLTEGEAPRGQHYRPDPDDDPTGYGRHSR